MTPLTKFDLTVKSAIVRGEKPNKGLEAQAAPTPHQMNRLTGYLGDGRKILVAQRPGRGGMDFNKLLGGKVYAVAADALSPVYEKDKDGKATRTQKQEEGLPLFSSSGFYLLSSKEYPAVQLFEAFTLLRQRGEQVWLLTEEQLTARQRYVLNDELDWDVLSCALESALADEHNLVACHDPDINKKRKLNIDMAKMRAASEEVPYDGVEFNELGVSKKDGNPFLMYCWHAGEGPVKSGALLREAEVVDEDRDAGRTVVQYFSPADAVARFAASAAGQAIRAALEAGQPVTFSFVQGHVMRTSVSFRRKAENVLNKVAKSEFGDGVYILAALKGWTKGIIALMQSQHPSFPQADYDAHHYVAACRQAEIGMNKNGEGKFGLPVGIHYSLAERLTG